jgi:hypothetical protein
LTLTLEKYESWISVELEKMLRPVKAKATKLLAETARSVVEARSTFQGLSAKGERDMNTKRDAASYRAARTIGHSAQQAFQILQQVQPSSEASWESLKNLKDDISRATRTIRDLRNKTSMELSGFYILDMRSFSGAFERLAKNGERLSAFLDGEGSSLQKARTINGIIDNMKVARHDFKARSDELANLEIKKLEVENSIIRLLQHVERLSEDRNVGEILAAERELRQESKDFRTETLTHLKRPLRRLREISERGEFPIDPEQREALSQYLEKPYKSFLSGRIGLQLKPILENMKRAIDAGKMEFKHRKSTRVSAQLNQLISTNLLSEKRRRGRELANKRRTLLEDPQTKKFYLERKEVLSKIDATKKQQASLEERIASIRHVVQVANQRVSQLASLAENKTREYVGLEAQIERPTTS